MPCLTLFPIFNSHDAQPEIDTDNFLIVNWELEFQIDRAKLLYPLISDEIPIWDLFLEILNAECVKAVINNDFMSECFFHSFRFYILKVHSVAEA